MIVSGLDRVAAGLWRKLPAPARSFIDNAYAHALVRTVPVLASVTNNAAARRVAAHVSVIVPIHNAVTETARCLRSLRRFADGAEVILVDDGSTDTRIASLLAEYEALGWLVLRHPVGSMHSAACTRGIQASTRRVILLLNSDTVVTQTSFESPVRLLLQDPSIGAAGPVISQGWGPQIDLRMKRCRYLASDAQIFGRAEWRARRYAGAAPRDLPKFVDGCAFFVRRETWDAVGGFENCRPHWGNDVDLCAKLIARGLRIVCCDSAYVHHLGGASKA